MNDRSLILLHAAQVVFSRYGVSKTTMNDVAREAGVARQTLYNAYSSKNAVLRAVLRHGSDQTIAAVEARWRNQDDLDDKLETFFELAPLYWYDIVVSSPEMSDLIDGIHAVAHDEMIAIARLWIAKFEVLFQAHSQDRTAPNIITLEMADFFYSTSMNAKYNVENRDILKARLKVLKLSVLALIDGANTNS